MQQKLWQSASLSAVAIALSTPAAAQTSTQSTEGAEADASGDIIVTARKREERLQDVPAVVSALSGQTIDDLGGSNHARDLVAVLPGVTFIESANGPTAEPNLRGAGQARLPNSDAAIGLYRNGAYIVGGNLGGRTFQRFDMFDLERTEVLRGPQGALYGRNAVGGAINVISARPRFESEGEVTLIGGSQQTYGVQAIVNIPLSDKAAVRAGLDFENKDDGFYTLAISGEPYDTSKYRAGRLSVLFQPTDSLEIVLLGDYSDEEGDGGASIPIPFPNGDEFLVLYNTPNFRTAEQYNLSANIEWSLGDTVLTSVTNYRNRKSSLLVDNDGLSTLSEINLFDDRADTLFQELRATGESGAFKWLVGADLFHLNDAYDTSNQGRAIIPATMTMAAINPNYTQNTDFQQTSYAAFASAEANIVGGLSLEVEGRYSVDQKDLTIVALRADGTPRFTDFPPNSPASSPSATFKNFNYGVTGSYKFSPDILLFGRVATAYRAGGFNADLGNPCGTGEVPGVSCNIDNVPPTYGEEHSINYEIGIKSTWLDRRVTLNANLYRINYEDILANLNNGIMPMADPLNGALYLDNAGDAKAWGFEIEMAIRPPLPPEAGNLQLGLTVGKQEGEFRNVPARITAVANGNDLARLRDWTLSGNFVYRLPLTGQLKLLLAGNYLYEEGGWQNAINTFRLGYTDRLNLRAALETDNWQLALFVRNALDSRYLTNQGGTSVNGFGTEFRRNDPRSYEVSLRYRW